MNWRRRGCELETRVEERTRELSLVKARLETALRGAYVHAFSQDRELRYTWVYNPDNAEAAAEMIGRTDNEIFRRRSKTRSSPSSAACWKPAGRKPARHARSIRAGRRMYSLHIAPAFGPDGRVDGITGVAIDISRSVRWRANSGGSPTNCAAPSNATRSHSAVRK